MKITRGRTFNHRDGQKELKLFELVELLKRCLEFIENVTDEDGDMTVSAYNLFVDIKDSLKHYKSS